VRKVLQAFGALRRRAAHDPKRNSGNALELAGLPAREGNRRHDTDQFPAYNAAVVHYRHNALTPAIKAVPGLDATEQEILRVAGVENKGFNAPSSFPASTDTRPAIIDC